MGESTGREEALTPTPTPTPPPPPPAVGDLGRQRQPCYSQPSSSASTASSSSGRREADAEEDEGEQRAGKKKQGRRKSRRRREVVVRAIRDRLPAAPSCWGNASAVQGIGWRSQRERPRDVGRGGDAVEEDDSGLRTATGAPPWCCCVCLEEDCSLEPNPSANGKEDAGARSLIERNDFYSDDCNPHAASAVASPGARFD